MDDREFIITMLPNGNNVKDVCMGEDGLLKQDKKSYTHMGKMIRITFKWIFFIFNSFSAYMKQLVTKLIFIFIQ